MREGSGLLWGAMLGLVACGSNPPGEEKDDSAGDTQLTDSDTQSPADGRFSEHVLPESIRNGGYMDSTFINKAGDRIYFLHSIFSPRVLDGHSAPEGCSHVEAAVLPGHISTPGLEWASDLYFVEWDGEAWSEPVNLGAPVNTMGMECCMWLNEDETEIIYNTLSDLDGDGVDGDLGLLPTGNYRATRADRDSAWSEPVPMPGEYGTEGQGEVAVWRNDIEKVPSGNLYLWERTLAGENLLVFGERNGGTDDEPTYAPPVNIDGTTHSETQVWVNESETRLVFNHRQDDGETELYTRQRASASEAWGASEAVTTTGFADPAGNNVWGEPSFDATESFMFFTRFDTSDADCWTSDLMVSFGDVETGFSAPIVLN